MIWYIKLLWSLSLYVTQNLWCVVDNADVSATMSFENQPAMWMTTPWHQYHLTSVPAQCLCFQSSAASTPVKAQSTDLCMPTSNSTHCDNPGHHLLGFIPSIALSGQLQLPSNSICTCFSGRNNCHKVASSVKCLCNLSQRLHMINSGFNIGGTCPVVSPLPDSAVRVSGHSSAKCDEKLKVQSQQCGTLSCMKNTSEPECGKTQVSAQAKEDGQLLCKCPQRLTSQGSCCVKSNADQSFSHKSVCNKCFCGESELDRNVRDNDLVPNCSSCKKHLVFKEGSNLQDIDDGCVDVLKWQHWHLQQLAMQKSQVSKIWIRICHQVDLLWLSNFCCCDIGGLFEGLLNRVMMQFYGVSVVLFGIMQLKWWAPKLVRFI